MIKQLTILLFITFFIIKNSAAEDRYNIFITNDGDKIISTTSTTKNGVIRYVDQRGYPGIIKSSDIKKTYEHAILIEKIGEDKEYEDKLAERLMYLGSLYEVTWVKIKRNNVYIGLNHWTNEFKTIIPFAAFFGNKTIDFGVHVWAFNERGNIANYSGLYCSASARHGKVYKNDCR